IINRHTVKKIVLLIVLSCIYQVNAQKLLTSWSQSNIENYTKEMYDRAHTLTQVQLLENNVNAKSWADFFSPLYASVNNYSKDEEYHKGLTSQLNNQNVTKLQGTSRLIIWDRITSGDIIFEGKGLVIENDLFTVAGRANQILQNLTGKNFGYVLINSTKDDL